MTSYFASKNSNEQSDKNANHIINEALTMLRDFESKIDNGEIKYESRSKMIKLALYKGGTNTSEKITKPDFEPSLTYLDKKEIRDELSKIIFSYKINDVTIEIKELLGLVYCEMVALSKGYIWNSTYVLNLWPCESCACIGVKKV